MAYPVRIDKLAVTLINNESKTIGIIMAVFKQPESKSEHNQRHLLAMRELTFREFALHKAAVAQSDPTDNAKYIVEIGMQHRIELNRAKDHESEKELLNLLERCMTKFPEYFKGSKVSLTEVRKLQEINNVRLRGLSPSGTLQCRR